MAAVFSSRTSRWPRRNKKAVDFFLKQSRKLWLQTDYRQTQGHLAIALKRFNAFNASSDATPLDIMKSLKERSVTQRGDGHVLARHGIELVVVSRAHRDAGADDRGVRRSGWATAQAVEDCRVWLLKQKQTQDWKTTNATADAVYALLLRGKDLLSQRPARWRSAWAESM